MKAFVKTCWLELALFALGLLAGLGPSPSCRRQSPASGRAARW